MSGLKYNGQTPNALLFDKCLEEEEYRYDFTEWTPGSEQPSGGITVEKGKITINKFKPNVPILVSNFTGTGTGNTPKSTEICDYCNSVKVRLSGFSANSNVFTNYEETNIRRYWITQRIKGLWFGPIYTYNNKVLPIESVCDGTDGQYITYTDETTVAIQDETTALRGTGGGFAQYFHVTDKEDLVTPDWVSIPNNAFIRTETEPYWNWSPAGDCMWQVGVVLFTGATPEQDGCITLETPIVISIENHAIIDPTTVEGYRAAVGNVEVYNKEMTFQNVLMAHKLAFKETGTFTETIQGVHPQITSHYGNEQNTAFVISEREYRELYDHIRLPEITDLGTLVQQSFPFKFWAKLERDSNHTHIWSSLYAAFFENSITDETFANHLFSKSSGDLYELSLKFDVGLDSQSADSKIIDLMGIFDYSNLVQRVNFTILTGNIFSLVNAFRQTKTLESIVFNKTIHVSDFQGSFEGTALVNFPGNVAASNRWPTSTSLSGPICSISDCADGSALTHFGNWMADPGQDGVIPASTFTPVTPSTSTNVGTVIISGTVDSTKEYTLKANVCPGVMVPSFDGETYQIRRLRPNYLSDGIVFIIQGIGYDSSSNKIAATPSYIIDAHATFHQFNANTLFTEINYVPDSLNTSYVGVPSSEIYSDGFSSKYYRRCSDFGSWQPGYIEMSLTAIGLQRMQINMTVINVDSTITASSYTVNSHSAPHVFTYDTSYSVTAWGIEGFAYAMLEQDRLVVNPYCRNAFYNSAIEEVRYILDMKYVEPLYGMIGGDEWGGNRWTIFGNGLETAYISNINKGNWSLDGTARPDVADNNICGGDLSNFSAECANYLVSNLFDLRRNTTEADRLENEINSFNGWTIASGSNGWKRPIVFYASGNATMSRSITASDVLKLNATFADCTVAVKRGLSTTQLVQGRNEINVFQGDTVQIVVTATGSYPSATVELAEPFLSELTENLSTANVYLPSSWSSLLDADVVRSANDKGWVVYVGGNVYSV